MLWSALDDFEVLQQRYGVLRSSPYIGVRGSPERDISFLRAFGPGGGQIWGVVRVSARAPFVFLGGK